VIPFYEVNVEITSEMVRVIGHVHLDLSGSPISRDIVDPTKIQTISSPDSGEITRFPIQLIHRFADESEVTTAFSCTFMDYAFFFLQFVGGVFV